MTVCDQLKSNFYFYRLLRCYLRLLTVNKAFIYFCLITFDGFHPDFFRPDSTPIG